MCENFETLSFYDFKSNNKDCNAENQLNPSFPLNCLMVEPQKDKVEGRRTRCMAAGSVILIRTNNA